jgi:hypothetical protein
MNVILSVAKDLLFGHSRSHIMRQPAKSRSFATLRITSYSLPE